MQYIQASDFGPVESAKLALTPLTVLIGPNNTGKSYVALAIYSLMRAVRVAGPSYGRNLSSALRGLPPIDRSGYRTLSRIVDDAADSLPDYAKIWNGETAFVDWPFSVRQRILQESRSWSSIFSQEFNNELLRCFGTTLSQLGRRSKDTRNRDFRIEFQDDDTGFDWQIQRREDELITKNWKPTTPDPTKLLPPMRTMRRTGMRGESDQLARYLLAAYSQLLFANFSFPAHYLPASRTGILVGHKTLSSLIVAQASSAWIEPLEIDRLPGVVTDLVRSMLLLDETDHPSPELQSIVDFLESRITKGTVDIQRQSSGYPAIIYTTDAGIFQLHQVSSTVSEVAPLIIFLKYYIKRGDLLIFEEPESHLDPVNQRDMGRALAMMVNAGIRVLVTTHSDILLNQIINLVQASDLPKDHVQDFEYCENEILSPNDVSAYLFDDLLDGTVARSLPIYPDEGLVTEAFSDVHRALYDEAVIMEYGG